MNFVDYGIIQLFFISICQISISKAVDLLWGLRFSWQAMMSPVSGLIYPTFPLILKPSLSTNDYILSLPSKGSSVNNSFQPNEGPFF
jgi:hypothetical protein